MHAYCACGDPVVPGLDPDRAAAMKMPILVFRSGASDAEVAQLVRDSVGAKKAGHGINSDEFVRPERAMYQIGG